MRYTNKIYQPLRFAEASTEHIALRHAALKYNNIVPLVASRTQLLPFELFRSVTDPSHWVLSALQTDIYIVNYLTGAIRNVTSNLTLFFGQREIAPSDYEMFVTYKGDSTITALGQGIYRIHAVASDGFEWWSDPFKVGFFDTITFEFKNTSSFGNLWMSDFYWKAAYEGINYDTGEFEEYVESNKDDDDRDIPTYQRLDKLRSVAFLADSNAIDTLKMAKLCDTIYITDELGLRQRVELMDVTSESIDKSHYMTAIVQYRILEDSIITVNKQTITYMATQVGAADPVDISNQITFDGEPIEFGGEPITFNQ